MDSFIKICPNCGKIALKAKITGLSFERDNCRLDQEGVCPNCGAQFSWTDIFTYFATDDFLQKN